MTGRQLRNLLDKHETTQRRLASLLDIGERHVRRYVAGEAEIPVHIAIAVRCLLGVCDHAEARAK